MSGVMRIRSLCFSFALLLGCSEETPPPDEPLDLTEPPDNCPAMFKQDILPEYHVELAAAGLAKLEDEFLHRPQNQAAGKDINPYHPVKLTYKDGTQTVDVPSTLIRLKGQSSWLQTIMLDAKPKMQFVLAFNEIDPKGRFLGVRKVELDMPRTDRTFLRQRLALYYLRAAGVPAQCANNAKLYINGKYYGLFTNLERLDKEFLQRHFPDADNGDLWKGGRIIKTNEETFTWDRLEAFWHGTFDIGALDALADLPPSVKVWAAEASMGDADGYYNGRPNYYLYDHPTRGFVWIPNDLDTAFDVDFLPPDASLVFPICTGRTEDDRLHYNLVMNDPPSLDMYVAALRDTRAKYDVAALDKRVHNWSRQIRKAAADDEYRPFSMDDHDFAVSLMRAYVSDRADSVDTWLACRQGGGKDEDGDGYTFCNDCDDRSNITHPDAAETCNGLDDDCDGFIDAYENFTTCQ